MKHRASIPHRPLRTEILEERELLAGGFTGGGLLGSYYATASLPAAGTAPAFSRTDAHLDFAYAANQSPGGSSDPAFSSVASSDYSARWTGQLIAAYSETYQLYLTADAGVRLSIRPTGTANYTVLYDQLGSASATSADAAYNFVAGTSYDIVVEYDHFTGPANLKLEWSSPSTPRAVVEENQALGINVGTAWSYQTSDRYFADAIKSARPYFEMPGTPGNTDALAPHDANGWPTQDADLVVWEGTSGNQGTYQLSFKGQATVSTFFGNFVVNGTSYGGILPIGAAGAYNAATDTTTALFQIPIGNASTDLVLHFTQTVQQSAGGTTGGVKNVSLMRPSSPGSSTPLPAGTLYMPSYLAALEPYQTIRTLGASEVNSNPVANWSQRTAPGSWFSQNYYANPQSSYQPTYLNDGIAWEYIVAMANESGKDLYINIPALADDAYITELADLLKYGSDGTNAYTSPQANPVWAPLDPNLRVYLEYSNELWNTATGYGQYTQNASAALAAVQGNTAVGAALNYDHLPDNATTEFDWAIRRAALETYNIAADFSAVYGSSAMLTTVRPVLCWFNDNLNSTAREMLSFLDNYFDNADGTAHVSNPKPIDSYIWGAGGGGYYDASDSMGIQTSTTFANSGFESVSVPSGTGYVVDPTNAGWTFSGFGGIAGSGYAGAPTAPEGSQVAFLAAGSSISESVYFATPGVYGLLLDATTGKFDASEDGAAFGVGYASGSPYASVSTTYLSNALPGYLTVTTAGFHTITIEADPANAGSQYFDAIQITSAAAIFAGSIPISQGDVDADYFPNPGTGDSHTSYQRSLAMEVNWAKAYGLNEVTYESGWGLGGVAALAGVQYWAQYRDTNPAQTALVQQEAIADYDAAGGSLLFVGSFPQWEDPNSAPTAPLVVAETASEATLPAAATNGFAYVPGQTLVLTPGNVTLQPNNTTLDNLSPGYNTSAPSTIAAGADDNFLSWNVVVPAGSGTQNFTVAAALSGSGSYQLWVDGAVVDAETVNGGKTFTASVALIPGLHSIQVKAAAGSFSIYSVSLAATGTVSQTPAAPTNLQVTALTTSSIAASWTANATNATGYILQVATDYAFTNIVGSTTIAGNATSGTVSGLQAGTSYFLRVSAYNSAGSAASAVVSTTTSQSTSTPPALPAAPSNLHVTAVSTTTITLAWTDNATNATSYLLQAASDYAFTNIVTSTSLGVTATTGTLSGLQPGTSYFIRLSAVNAAGSVAAPLSAAGTSPASTAPPTAPAAPSNLKVTAVSTTTVTLAWTSNATNATSYLLQAASDYAFTNIVTSTSLGGTATTGTLSGLQPGTSYFIRLSAVNAAGSSAAPLTAAGTSPGTTAPPTLPAAPSNLHVSAVSATSISLAWNANATNATSYLLQAASDYAFTNIVTSATFGGTASSGTLSGLQAGTTYFLLLSAVNSAGSAAAPESAAGTAPASTAPPTAPAAPSNIQVTAVTTTSISLAWTANATNATSYLLQAASDYAFTNVVASTTFAGNATSGTFTGLTPGTSYFLRLSAVNAAGSNAAPLTSAGTAPGSSAPPGVPAAPSNVHVTAVTTSTISLAWNDNATNETGYTLLVSPTYVFGSNVQTLNLPANSTSDTLTGLAGGTTYFILVEAVNAAGVNAAPLLGAGTA